MPLTIGQVLASGEAAVGEIGSTIQGLPQTIATAKSQLAQASELRVVIPLAIFGVGLLVKRPILGAVLAAGLLLWSSDG